MFFVSLDSLKCKYTIPKTNQKQTKIMKHTFMLFFFFMSFCAFSQSTFANESNNKKILQTTNNIDSNCQASQVSQLLQDKKTTSNYFYTLNGKVVTRLELFYNLRAFFIGTPLILTC